MLAHESEYRYPRTMRARALDRALESLHRFRTEQERRGILEFPRTLGELYAEYLSLPGLVAFWPMSSVQRSTGQAYDISGQARHLTYNGNPQYNLYNSLVPYLDCDGTGDFLSRADETDLDILGTETIYSASQRGLTLGGWFWFDVVPASTRGIFGKWNDVGVNQRSYALFWTSFPVLGFIVSVDGTAATLVTGAESEPGGWYFIVGRFSPSTELALFVNGVKTVNTTSIPASIFASTATLAVPQQNVGGVANNIDGRVSHTFLCANVIPDARIQRLFKLGRLFFGV